MQNVTSLRHVCGAECEEVRWHGRLLTMSRHSNKTNHRAPAWVAIVTLP